MPDSSKYQIGVEIGATGAEKFKKDVDSSVKSLETLKSATVNIPKADLSKVVTGVPELQKQVSTAGATLAGISKAFVQLPKVDVSKVVTGVPELRTQVESAVNTLAGVKGAFVQFPKIDVGNSVTGLQDLNAQVTSASNSLDGLKADFAAVSGVQVTPPQISQSVASIESYRKSVQRLRTDLAAGFTPKISVNIFAKSIDQLQDKLSSLNAQLRNTTDPVLFKKLTAEAVRTQAAIGALDKSVAASKKTLQGVAPGAGQAAQSLTNLGRIAQDAPFGFIGIQNNIGPLVDSFGYLTTATKNAGGPLKALSGALIGPAGIGLGIALVTGLLTVATQKYGSLGNAINVVFGLTTNLQQANRDLAKSFAESEGSTAGEVANIRALVGIAENKALADGTRQQALNKLNKEYDAYLPKLTLETIGTNAARAAIDKLTSSLVRQAKIKGVQDLISKEAGEQAKLLAGDLTDNLSVLDEVSASIKSVLNPTGVGTGTSLAFERIVQGAKTTTKEVGKSQERISAFDNALKKLLQTEAEQETLDPGLKEKKIKKAIDLLGQQLSALERVRKTQQEIADIPTIDKKIASFDTTGLTDAQVEELTGKKKIEQALKDVEALIGTSEKIYKLRNLKIDVDFKKGIIDKETANEQRNEAQKTLQDAFTQQALIFEATARVKPTVIIERADLSQSPEQIKSKIAETLGLDKTLSLEPSARLALKIEGIDTRQAMAALESLKADFVKQIDSILNEGMAAAAISIGEGIGNAFSGEGLKGLITPFLNVIATAITELGKATIAYGVAMTAVQEALKKTFSNPYVAIAAGIAAVAIGQVLRNKASKSAPKFESGGIISGPSSGYPVMLHGTEAIVPLKNNKFPFGMQGGSTGANMDNIVGVIRGRDIELINRRAQTSRRRI